MYPLAIPAFYRNIARSNHVEVDRMSIKKTAHC